MTRAVLYLALLLVSSASNGEVALYSQGSQIDQSSICVNSWIDTEEINFDDVDEGGPLNQSQFLAQSESLLYPNHLARLSDQKQANLPLIRAPPSIKVFKYS